MVDTPVQNVKHTHYQSHNVIPQQVIPQNVHSITTTDMLIHMNLMIIRFNQL